MKLVEFEVAKVHFLPYNPNRLPAHRLDALAASHQEFGVLQPAVVNRRTGPKWPKKDQGLYVVGGEHRLRVAKKLGLDRYPCVEVKVDRRAEEVMNLALNNAGDYDPEKLAALLADLKKAEANLSSSGFTQSEIDAYVRKLERELHGDSDADLVPEKPVKAKTELGEVLKLGAHRMLCADSTDPKSVRLLLGDLLAALYLTDPPYAIYGSASGLSSEITDDKIVRPFFEKVLAIAKEHTRRSAHAYVFCDWRSWPSWWEMAKRTRMIPLNLLIWDKGGAGLGSNYANSYEAIGFFGNITAQKVMITAEKRGTVPVLKSNILRYNRVPSSERQHNAAKPVALLQELIENSTKEGDVVLDPFAGSGSTLIACEKTGRTCYAVEVDPGFCDVTRERWEKLVGKSA